jgi:phosphatidylglycerol---prolipoprotein diacylglyceryl transferase
MIDFTPSSVAIQIGPLPVYWYGVAYAVGLAAAYAVMVRQAVRYGQDPSIVGNGLIIVAVAALIGGRLYHVIDQWALYKDDLLKIVLPPYSGLGVYGGLITGTIAFIFLTRRWHLDLWTWADIVAPALFAMQAIGRWGNFFNQELYGPPTTLPWGIAIDCVHRVELYPCSTYPLATTHFHPLFLYESISGIVGATVLIWLSRRRPAWLRSGDLLLIFFIWYAVVRFLLEFLRIGRWTLGDVPTAQIFSALFIVASLAVLIYRHRGPRPVAEEAPAAALESASEAAAAPEAETGPNPEPALESAPEAAPEAAAAPVLAPATEPALESTPAPKPEPESRRGFFGGFRRQRAAMPTSQPASGAESPPESAPEPVSAPEYETRPKPESPA